MNQPSGSSFLNQGKLQVNEKQWQATSNPQISNNFQKIQIPAPIQPPSQVRVPMNQQFQSFIPKQIDQEAKNSQINNQKIEESKKELQQQFQKDINELENKITLLKNSLEKVNLETQVQVLEQQEFKKEIDNLKKHILRLENQQSQQNDSDKSENFEQIKSSVLDKNDKNNIQDIISQIENFKKDIQKDQDFFHIKLSKLESKNQATQEQVKQIQQLNNNQNTENIFELQQSIKRIEQQMNIQKLQTQTQNFQIANFYQQTEQIYQTNISDQNKSETQFEFIVEDDEQPFSIGIIQDGDLENQDSKTKFLQIQFPSGQLIRGAEDPINFLPRQFLRNDRVQMKVLKEKELFMVTLNGIDIPPIKIKEDLSDSHAFVIKSEYPLLDIISQDDEY